MPGFVVRDSFSYLVRDIRKKPPYSMILLGLKVLFGTNKVVKDCGTLTMYIDGTAEPSNSG